MLFIGRDLSPFVRRTATVLSLQGLKYKRRKLATAVPADLVKIKKLNPLGRVPALVLDDGEILIDSNAIIDYALETGSRMPRLCPLKGVKRRDILRLSAFATGVMEKGVASSYETLTRPEKMVHKPWLDHILDQVRQGLVLLESEMQDRDLAAEPDPTLADVNAVVAFDFISLIRPQLAKEAAPHVLPTLSVYFNRTPEFKKTIWRPAKK